MMHVKTLKLNTDMTDEVTTTDMSRTLPSESLTTLVNRLPGIAKNKNYSFSKLNKVVIQSLKDLTDLIDDMKGNLIPRHEMLFILHKIVESLSSAVDINSIDQSDTESEDEEEEDAQVPKEVQNWIHSTFMNQEGANESKVSNKSTLVNPLDIKRNKEEVAKKGRGKIDTTFMPDEIRPEVRQLLDRDKLWQFDIFDLKKLCGDQVLKVVLSYFFQKYNIFNTFRIPISQFNSLLNHIEFGYERYNNPYHNVFHGADVLQTLHSLLVLNNFMLYLSPLEMLTSFFAAAIHDYDHQGVTNSFIIENKYQLALTYNDFAVQENHHVSAAFKLMRKPYLNIGINMSKEQFTDFRTLCIKMVLATDMSQHFIQLKKFNSNIQSKETIKMHEYLAILLHTADLSNPAKEWNIHVKWVVYLFNEFFSQGDRERALGTAISPLCDRNSTLIFQSQIGFLDFIIQPTFDLFSSVSEDVITQYKETSIKDQLGKRLKARKGIANLVIQFKHCNNRPWEVCIMQNRSNWRRKGDKDYLEAKQVIENYNNAGVDKRILAIKEHLK